MDVALGFVLSHWEVMEEVVATGGWGGARDFCVIVNDMLEGLNHQGADGLAWIDALEDEVVAGETSHWSPVDDAVFPLFVVAEVGGNDMFDGVDGCWCEGWLLVRGSHAYVIGGDGVLADSVLAGDVYSWLEVGVVNLEAWD